MFLAWQCLCIAFGPTSNSRAAAFSAMYVDMLVYFPSFVLSADTSSDCTLSYEPLGWSAPLSTLHYVQPWCCPSLYPSELSPSSNTVSKTPALIEDDALVVVSALPDAPSAPPVDLTQVPYQLQSIVVSVLSPSAQASPSPTIAPPKSPTLLSTMSPPSPPRHFFPGCLPVRHGQCLRH